ncbi:MAG: transcription antitermination factor NusB [bacterium]|jgi:N utilization substance protein B|nr:transcription antitermination factor NusB [bacterium]
MTLRRKARELALQFLYGIEVNPGDLEEKLASFWQMNRTEREIEEFAASLIRGVVQHKEQIDRTISEHALNWDIQRIIPVDRNMLRLAVYELAFRPDIPHVVTINEAVDIAKKFGTAESGKFVNGILDNVRAKLAEA